MFRSAFGKLMGSPEHGPFLQRSLTVSSIDQRCFTGIIPSPHHNSTKYCHYACFTDSLDLKVQLTYHHALARKRGIWDTNRNILVQNPTIFLLPILCLSRVISISTDIPANSVLSTRMPHSDLPSGKAFLPNCLSLNSEAAKVMKCQLPQITPSEQLV